MYTRFPAKKSAVDQKVEFSLAGRSKIVLKAISGRKIIIINPERRKWSL